VVWGGANRPIFVGIDFMRETIVRIHRVFTGRIFGLESCEVALPDGRHAFREVIRHSGAAAVVPVDDDGKILLVRQYRVAADQMMVEIPAGLLDEHEDPAACASRELQEETGFKPGHLEAMGGLHTAAGYTSEFVHLFVATDLIQSRLAADTDEFIEVRRVALEDALAMIENGDITDAKTIIGLLRYAKHVGVGY
jgi:ADP-ribose diphosphatase